MSHQGCCCAVLCCAVLCCAVLCCAVLCCAVLVHELSAAMTCKKKATSPSKLLRAIRCVCRQVQCIRHRHCCTPPHSRIPRNIGLCCQALCQSVLYAGLLHICDYVFVLGTMVHRAANCVKHMTYAVRRLIESKTTWYCKICLDSVSTRCLLWHNSQHR